MKIGGNMKTSLKMLEKVNEGQSGTFDAAETGPFKVAPSTIQERRSRKRTASTACSSELCGAKLAYAG